MILAVWIGMIVIAALNLLLALVGALVGSFADGGGWWGYLVMVVAHPVAALALIALVAWRRPPAVAVAGLAGLLAISVAADVATAAAIGFGPLRGDWWLPLVFSAIPAIGLAYALTTRPRTQPPANPAQPAAA